MGLSEGAAGSNSPLGTASSSTRIWVRRSVPFQISLAAALAIYFAITAAVGRQNGVWNLGLQLSYPNTRFALLTTPHGGAARLEPISTGPYGMSAFEITSPDLGRRYILSALIRANETASGKHVTLQLNERRSGKLGLAIASKTFVLSTGWQRIVVQGRVGHPGDTLDAYVVVPHDNAASDAVYVAQWQLKRQPTR